MNRIRLRDIPFQPLQITRGWTVGYNEFKDMEPYSDIKVVGLPDEDVWEIFLQDLLQLQHDTYGITIDLGWVPEADPEGSYLLRVLKDEDWDNPLYYYKSKNKDDVVDKINFWLRRVTYDFDFLPFKAELN